MADILSRHQLLRLCRDEVLTRKPALYRASGVDGTDINLFINLVSVVGEELSAQQIDIAAALYLDSAEREELDWLIWNLFQILRKQASPALGSVDFSTTVANPTVFTIPAGLELASDDGVRFITTAAATFPMGSVGPVTVAVRSIEAGAAQQTDKNRIRNIVGTITGGAADLVVNNPLATAGADDQQQDPEFRDEARKFWTSARRGTAKAVSAAALRVPGVVTATAFDVIDVSGRPARFGQLVVTDRFTSVLADLNQSPAAYSTSSRLLAQSVMAGLSDSRPIGIYVHTIVAQIVMQEFTLALKFRAGANVGEVYTIARAAIVAKVNELSAGPELGTVRIGDRAYPDADSLNGVLRTVPGLDPSSYVASPAGDVIPRAQQAIRTDFRLVTAQSISSEFPIIDTANPDTVQVAA